MAFLGSVLIQSESPDLTISQRFSASGEQKIVFNEPVDANTTNRLIPIVIDASETQMMTINADGPLTIKTNSSGSPDDTITLVANQQQVFCAGSFLPPLLSTDVTKIYVTNATSNVVNLSFMVLQNIA